VFLLARSLHYRN